MILKLIILVFQIIFNRFYNIFIYFNRKSFDYLFFISHQISNYFITNFYIQKSIIIKNILIIHFQKSVYFRRFLQNLFSIYIFEFIAIKIYCNHFFHYCYIIKIVIFLNNSHQFKNLLEKLIFHYILDYSDFIRNLSNYNSNDFKNFFSHYESTFSNSFKTSFKRFKAFV